MYSVEFPKVTISVLTHNRSDILRKLLESLEEIHYRPVEKIVVDNCSADDTRSMVRKLFPAVKYIGNETNLGATARNIGMKHASGKVVITLDDDVAGLNDNHISILLDYFNDRPALGAVNFKVLDNVTGKICNWVHHYPVEEYATKELPTYEITEGAVAFRKEALSNAGCYPEKFFISHEGVDLALRLLNTGYEVIYSPKIELMHYHAKSGRRSWLNYYYDTRNQFWLAARNFPLGYALKYLARGLMSMLIYSIRDGFLLYWLKGVKDGIRGLGDAFKDRSVVNDEVMRFIRRVEKNRPNIGYYLRTRLLQRSARL